MKDSFITKTGRGLITMVACLLICGAVVAQKTITGKVIERKTNNVVEGVSILEKGTQNGVSTDEGGNFSITVRSANPVLEVSFVGHKTQTITVGNRSRIDLFIEEEVSGLNDVVVIGYQSITRRTTTAAIATVKGKDIENMPYPTFDQMLQGRVAGLNILNISGEPGASAIVNIRGSSAVQNPNAISAPLYVIDGIVFDVSDQRSPTAVNPLSSINPNDIESIDVLKDASAAAIYGSRAGNGVIIVKTKKPKGGAPQIRVSSYIGISARPRMKPIIVGAAERRQKMDILTRYAPYNSMALLNQMLTDSLNPAFNNNTDFQGLFLQEAMINNVEASIAQNTEKFGYRLSFSRYYEGGVMRGYDFTRTSPRLFISAKPSKKLEVTTDLFFNFQKTKSGPGNTGFSRYPFNIWGFPSSFWQLTEQDMKNYTGRNDQVYDDNRATSLNGNTRAIYRFNDNLILTSSMSYNFGFNRRDYLQHMSVNPARRNDASSQVNNSRRWENENYLTYNKSFNNETHNMSILVGQSAEELVQNSTSVTGRGITANAIVVVQGVPSGPNLSGNSNLEERSRLSFFSRAHYDYKGKYGIDLSLRREASSRFSANDRWGSFPAISAQWTVSEENFFEPIKNVVSFLKFRGSFGITGRDPISYYGRYISLSNAAGFQGSSTGLGGGANLTYNGVTVAYPNYGSAASVPGITWESAPQTNVGVDLNLFGDRISFTADYYSRENEDLVFDVPVQVTTGFTTARDNYVSIRNRGIEFTITSNNLHPKAALKWTTTLNFAYNQNFISKLPYDNRDFGFGDPWLRRVLTIGQPAFQFLVWDVPKIYNTVEEIPVDPLTGRRMAWGNTPFSPGDPARVDINGDYVINDFDRFYVGDPNTKVTGGLINFFQYKSFTLQVLCNFITGRKLWNGYLSDKMQDAGNPNPWVRWGPTSAVSSDFRGAEFWFPASGDAQFPGLITNAVDKWHIAQTFYVEDASFFRVKNIMLGYTLPGNIANRVKMKSLRLYGSIDNIWIYSKATVPDPEPVQPDGYSNGNDYPLPRKLTVGLEFNF